VEQKNIGAKRAACSAHLVHPLLVRVAYQYDQPNW
jgi:hypothetical protein